MIPVKPKNEPAKFDSEVRQPGQKFCISKGIDVSRPLPPKTKLNDYWRNCLDDLFVEYDEICAYLAIRIRRVTGEVSVDHYLPKTKRPDLAYEWSNYRLASMGTNTKKLAFTDVIDPFSVKYGWFLINFITGAVYANPTLSKPIQTKVQKTIHRLKLDRDDINSIRMEYFNCYLNGEIDEVYLKRNAPFVWYEAQRQGLL